VARTTHQPEEHTDISVETVHDGKTPEEVNVLHVDDSAEFVEMAAMYLRKNNDSLNVETETDPVEALERLEGDESFDCVISDCSMPGMEMDGMELRAEVRERYPDLSFVFFTSTPLSEFSPEVVADGSTGHTQKGIDVKQFSNLAGWITETVE